MCSFLRSAVIISMMYRRCQLCITVSTAESKNIEFFSHVLLWFIIDFDIQKTKLEAHCKKSLFKYLLGKWVKIIRKGNILWNHLVTVSAVHIDLKSNWRSPEWEWGTTDFKCWAQMTAEFGSNFSLLAYLSFSVGQRGSETIQPHCFVSPQCLEQTTGMQKPIIFLIKTFSWGVRVVTKMLKKYIHTYM